MPMRKNQKILGKIKKFSVMKRKENLGRKVLPQPEAS